MIHWRINLILLSFFLFGAALVGQLFFIQVVRNDYYKALAQGQYITFGGELTGERGEIFFRGGEQLAINVDWPLVFVSSAEIKEKEETAETLSQILNLDKDFVLEKIQTDSLYEVIKKRLTDEEIENIKKITLTGVHLEKELGRYYPQGILASKVAGFLDKDGVGQYGIEGYYNEILRGKRENRGQDIVLTLDYSIQFTAEKLLIEAKKNLDIEGGEIIVMEPGSGKILALADFPNFDPNKYPEIADFDIFQNGALQKIFEPGSIFKPITMASAINEGKITPSTTYQDPGLIEIGGWPIYNYDQRKYSGDITMTEVLEKSINTGAVFVQQQLGNNLFQEYIEKFGVFEPSGIDLQETYSENKEFKKGYEINFATASFGQGIEMTPMQLVKAYSAIINGGKLVKPYIVEKIIEKDEESIISPEVSNETIISVKTAPQVTTMLVSVVENGYAKPAKIPGYYVAGKTGTAQISFAALNMDKKGYSEKTWQSFIGFAPAFNPKFLILVKLDNPKTKTAEYSAVPIFHDLAEYIINLWKIPPDYE